MVWRDVKKFWSQRVPNLVKNTRLLSCHFLQFWNDFWPWRWGCSLFVISPFDERPIDLKILLGVLDFIKLRLGLKPYRSWGKTKESGALQKLFSGKNNNTSAEGILYISSDFKHLYLFRYKPVFYVLYILGIVGIYNREYSNPSPWYYV